MNGKKLTKGGPSLKNGESFSTDVPTFNTRAELIAYAFSAECAPGETLALLKGKTEHMVEYEFWRT